MGDTNKPKTIYYELADYDYFGDFITSPYVKEYWTACYALCLYWGLFWFSRHIFGDGNDRMFNRQEAVHNLESDRNRNNSRQHLIWTNSSTAVDIFTKLDRTCNLLRDLTLQLLSTLVINTMARGGKRPIMILAWTYFVVAIIWSIFEMISSHHLVRLSFSIVLYGICITIGAIAFQRGFDEFD